MSENDINCKKIAIFGKNRRSAEEFLESMIDAIGFNRVVALRLKPTMVVTLENGDEYTALSGNDASARGRKFDEAYVQNSVDRNFMFRVLLELPDGSSVYFFDERLIYEV